MKIPSFPLGITTLRWHSSRKDDHSDMTWRLRFSLSLSPDIFPFSSSAACVCRSPAEREIALRLWLIAFLPRERERKPFAFVNLPKLWMCWIWCCFWLLLSWHRLMSGVVQCTYAQFSPSSSISPSSSVLLLTQSKTTIKCPVFGLQRSCQVGL